MSGVWRMQKRIKADDRVPNPVLQERQHRRRRARLQRIFGDALGPGRAAERPVEVKW